jgi:hypothetical protein
VWLVEVKAVRIDGSRWAPLFTAVAEPNSFTSSVEQSKAATGPLPSLDEFWEMFDSPDTLAAARAIRAEWTAAGHKVRLGPNHMVLEALGPSKNGYRTVVTIYADGRVMVPFYSYEGANSGIPVAPLCTPEFRSEADVLFGFSGQERLARTAPGWLDEGTSPSLRVFCDRVAAAYAAALLEQENDQ